MSEIPKVYEPHAVEAKWYQFWLEQGCFTADPGRVSPRRPAYSIVIPPPNVTGVLTLGHVLNTTVQDVLARKARMDGKEVLWLPGTDHAGIATQTVVEKTLRKQGLLHHRDELGREKFLEHVWAWKEKHGGIIIQQLKKLGCSCDWSRERFTLDPEYSRAVQKVFVDLYRKGLIYRGRRMVNWCPVSRTALSDEEVIMKEQKGFLYYFRVQVVESDGSPIPLEPGPAATALPAAGEGGAASVGPSPTPWGPLIDEAGRTWLTIATTRPETIPADTAVAVHPEDPRYGRFIGKWVKRALPLEDQALIPIIGDEQIDRQFGTGVLKVTPAHDAADYEIGLRHRLPVREVLEADGTLNARAGRELAGLDRMVGRKKAAELLEAAGALVKTEPYVNHVGFSERADVPIEPRLSEQWFLKYPSVEPATRAVEEGQIAFHPHRWVKTYTHWMGQLRDWCISRQLWWGHRIPVWTRAFPTEHDAVVAADRLRTNGDKIAVRVEGKTVYAATEMASLQDQLNQTGWQQDPDVLDTWFSSWLWPFATLGWTGDKATDARNATLQKFYPTTDLVTGPDILFFWVARMIMAGYEFMGERPFHHVYFTGIIRDKLGRKMSKSLGNSPDPLELIAHYGADALRLGTLRSAPLGQDVLFDEQNVELGRNFCNKLWNACRFRQLQGGAVQGEIQPELLSSDDRWILLRLDQAIREVTRALAEYKFNEVAATLHRFFWAEYCDWYLEAAKATLQTPEPARQANTLTVMDFVLNHTLRLFHPLLPFITEELWHGLGYAQDLPPDQGGRTIQFAPWPKPLSDEEKAWFGLDRTVEGRTAAKYELVSLGRNLRVQFNLPANRRVTFLFRPAEPISPHELEVLRHLLNADTLQPLAPDWRPPRLMPSAANALGELFLPLEGLVDAAAERARLNRELEKVRAEIAKVREKLDNPHFVQKVPPAVLEAHHRRLAEWQAREGQLLQTVAQLPD